MKNITSVKTKLDDLLEFIDEFEPHQQKFIKSVADCFNRTRNLSVQQLVWVDKYYSILLELYPE